MSNHIAAKSGDIAKTVLMPGDPLRARFIAETFLEDAKLYNEVRGMLGYTGYYKGTPVSIQGSGMGMPSMGIYSYELFNEYDVDKIIRIGTAGSFNEDIKIGDIVVSLASSTDSNYGHTFKLPGHFSTCCSYDLLKNVQQASIDTGLSFKAGPTVCCDVFYEEDPSWWLPWKNVGIMAVEMEASALYMNAAKAGKQALAMMTISDHFVTGEAASHEDRQLRFTNMMELALEAAIK